MKKILLISILALLFGFGVANAQPTKATPIQNVAITQNTHSLSSADQSLIFGSEVNAVVLGNDEMQSTQGFGFWSSVGSWLVPVGVVGAVAGCAVFAPACALAFAF